MPNAQDYYGSFGGVPDVAGGGEVSQRQSMRASPDDFGAQIGEANTRRGNQMFKTGQEQVERQTRYAAEATEAKVNDDYAKKYVPAAMQLRNQYDQLEGQDKVHGYESYVKGLQELNTQFLGDDRGHYEKQLWSGLTSRQLASETEYASRALAADQKQYALQALADKTKADIMLLANGNYNDPQARQAVLQRADASLEIAAIDGGLDPNSPEGSEAIAQSKQNIRGELGATLIDSAISRGDVNEAYKMRQEYGPFLPGHKQQLIDSVMYTENSRQVGINGSQALMSGQALPESPIGPTAQVRAVVADTAQTHGIDPNHALTVAQIESSMGANVGKRGDIGQTGKGGDLPTQATNMVLELKKSQDIAAKALGRMPDPWETYICYQQGAGGGPALLKASLEKPNARAVDVLAPLYKNPKDALSAITHNGGNASMTSGDFLDLIKDKYKLNAEQAECILPSGEVVMQKQPDGTAPIETQKPSSLGEAILKPHQTQGQAMQPASTPWGQLQNIDKKMPVLVEQANMIPNLSERKAVLSGLEAARGAVAAKAEAYKTQVYGQADQLKYSEGFTNIDQVDPGLSTILKTEFPDKWIDLKLEANKNRGAKENPEVTADLYSRVDSFFEKGRSKDQLRVKKDMLDDAARFKQEVLTASDNGTISAESAKALLKTADMNMFKLTQNTKDWSSPYGNDHYGMAYKEFVNSGASTFEVNKMFREYVAAADQLKFDREVDKGAWTDPKAWLGDTEDQKTLKTQINTVTKNILAQQAAGKYDGLVMLDNAPNAAIGRDGSSVAISAEEPKGKADARVATPFKTLEKNGMVFNVYPDGSAVRVK